MHWYYYINVFSMIYFCIVSLKQLVNGAQILNIPFLFLLSGAAPAEDCDWYGSFKGERKKFQKLKQHKYLIKCYIKRKRFCLKIYICYVFS